MEKENWFDIEFDKALKDLNPKASTGLSAMSVYGADIGTALRRDPVTLEYDPQRVSVLRHWSRMRMDDPEHPDPILAFVKPEPHSLQKLEEGRLRIISAVSFVDTMVDRVCFGWLNRRVLATVGSTPVLIGWNPYQGGYRLLLSRFGGEPAMCLDRSAWDWTVQHWLLEVVCRLIHNLALDAPVWWHEWLDARWKALFCDAVFGFRDGLRVRQPGWGVMKSGCYLTILINSVSQVCLHLLACRRMKIPAHLDQFFAMGDDTIQKVVEDVDTYVSHLEAMGAKLKKPYVSDEYEFCGHRIKGISLVPAYTRKHVFKIRTEPKATLPAVLQSYQWAYVHNLEMWEWLCKLMRELAPAMRRTRHEALTLVHDE